MLGLLLKKSRIFHWHSDKKISAASPKIQSSIHHHQETGDTFSSNGNSLALTMQNENLISVKDRTIIKEKLRRFLEIGAVLVMVKTKFPRNLENGI